MGGRSRSSSRSASRSRSSGPKEPFKRRRGESYDTREIQRALADRQSARRQRDFDRADRIRQELRDAGITIDDNAMEWRTPDGKSGTYGYGPDGRAQHCNEPIGGGRGPPRRPRSRSRSRSRSHRRRRSRSRTPPRSRSRSRSRGRRDRDRDRGRRRKESSPRGPPAVMDPREQEKMMQMWQQYMAQMMMNGGGPDRGDSRSRSRRRRRRRSPSDDSDRDRRRRRRRRSD